MIPPLVTSSLSCLRESQLLRGVLKLSGSRARHEEFQWCQRASIFPYPNTPQQPCETLWLAPRAPARAWALTHSSLESRALRRPRNHLPADKESSCSLPAAYTPHEALTIH